MEWKSLIRHFFNFPNLTQFQTRQVLAIGEGMAADFTYTAEDAERELAVLRDLCSISKRFHKIWIIHGREKVQVLETVAKHPLGLRVFGREMVRKFECQHIICLDENAWNVAIPFEKLALFRPNGWKSLLNKSF